MSRSKSDDSVKKTVLPETDQITNSSQGSGSIRSLRIVEDDNFDTASQRTLDLNAAPPKAKVSLGMYMNRGDTGKSIKPKLDDLSTIPTEMLLNKNKRRRVEEQSKSPALQTINSERICSLYKEGKSIHELSTEFCVPKHTISNIINEQNTPPTNNMPKKRSNKYPVISDGLTTLHSEPGPSLQPNEAVTILVEKDINKSRKKSTVHSEDEEVTLVKEAVDKCKFCPHIYEGTPTPEDRRYHLDEKCLGVLKLINQISKDKKDCTSQQFSVLESHFTKSDDKSFCFYCHQEVYPIHDKKMIIAKHFHLQTQHPKVKWAVKNLKHYRIPKKSASLPESDFDKEIARASGSSDQKVKTYLKHFITVDKNLHCKHCRLIFKKDDDILQDHIKKKCVKYQIRRDARLLREKNKKKMQEKKKSSEPRSEIKDSRKTMLEPGTSSKRSPEPEPESSSRSKPSPRRSEPKSLSKSMSNPSPARSEPESLSKSMSKPSPARSEPESLSKSRSKPSPRRSEPESSSPRSWVSPGRALDPSQPCSTDEDVSIFDDEIEVDMDANSEIPTEEIDQEAAVKIIRDLIAADILINMKKNRRCVKCTQGRLELVTTTSKTRDQWQWVCDRCGGGVGVRSGTFLEEHDISLKCFQKLMGLFKEGKTAAEADQVLKLPGDLTRKLFEHLALKCRPVKDEPSPQFTPHSPPPEPRSYIQPKVVPGVIKTEPLDEPSRSAEMFQADPTGKLCSFYQLLGDNTKKCTDVALLNNTMCLRHDNKLRMKSAREIVIPKRRRENKTNFPVPSSASPSTSTSSITAVPTPPPTSVAAPVLPPPTSVAAPVSPPPTSVAAPVSPPPTFVAAPVSPPPTSVAAPVSPPPTFVAAPVLPPPASVVAPVSAAHLEELDELPEVFDSRSDGSDGIEVLPDPAEYGEVVLDEGVSISIRLHQTGHEKDSQTESIELRDTLVQTVRLIQTDSTIQTDPTSSATVSNQYDNSCFPEQLRTESWESWPTISIDQLSEPLESEFVSTFPGLRETMLDYCEDLGLKSLVVALWECCYSLRSALPESVDSLNNYFNICVGITNLLNVIEGRLSCTSKPKREEVEEEMKSILVKLHVHSLIALVRIFKVQSIFSETRPATLHRICSVIIPSTLAADRGATLARIVSIQLLAPPTLIISLRSLAHTDKNLQMIGFYDAVLKEMYNLSGAVQKYVLLKDYWCQMMKLEDDITWPGAQYVVTTPDMICQGIFAEHGQMSDEAVPMLIKHLKDTFKEDECNELDQYLIKRSIIQPLKPPAPVASSSVATSSSSVSSSVDTTTMVETTSTESQCNMEEEESLTQIDLSSPLVTEPLEQALIPSSSPYLIKMLQGLEVLTSSVHNAKEEITYRLSRIRSKLAREESAKIDIDNAKTLLRNRREAIVQMLVEIINNEDP